MKIILLPLIGFFLCPAFVKAQTATANDDSLAAKMLTPIEMQQDFNYLRRALEETHPGLYRYNTKDQLKHNMDSLYGLLSTDMKFYDYYKLLAFLVAGIRCAHTAITPASDLNSMLSTCKTFPYWVFFAGGRVYITGVGTSDTIVHPGDELLSINGRSLDSIKQAMCKYLWMDGYIEIGKERMLDENFFSLFYYFFAEQPASFFIKCRKPNGELTEHKVMAATFQASLDKLLKNPVNKALLQDHAEHNKLNQQKPWRVEINKNMDAAVMTIRSFGGGKDGDAAKKKMDDFMDVSMMEIKKSSVKNLIIDLRLNHGGWDNQGEELFTYLIDTPAYYYRSFHAVTNSSDFLQFSSVSKEELKNLKNELIPEPDGTFTVKEEYNTTLLLQHPKANRFKGKTYFLMDGASGSTTAEFIAVAHSNQLGVFIGEECAGNYTGGNGGEFISLTLPLTKIHVNIPLLYYENAVKKPAKEGRGTIPDYFVPYSIKDIITGTDTQLNFTYDLIKKEK